MKKTMILITLGLTLLSCRHKSTTPNAEAETETLNIQDFTDTVIVETEIADITTFIYPVQATGKIKSAYEELIVAQNSGLIQFCKAKNGLRVKQNEIIASFETSDIELKKERILVQKFNAQKEYESQLLGYENLLKEKSAQEAEVVRQKLKASTGLLALDIDLRELEHALTRSSLSAPVDGVLAQVQIQKGMNIRSGQELYRIYSDERLYLEAQVLESDLPLLKIGQTATVKSAAAPKAYSAQLSEIDPIVDEHGLVKLHLSINNPKQLILGMNASAEINVPQKRGIVVPRKAILLRNNRPVVFTWEAGFAKWNYVSLGSENGEVIEILEGIKPGSEVIISNNIQLAHNAPVKKQ